MFFPSQGAAFTQMSGGFCPSVHISLGGTTGMSDLLTDSHLWTKTELTLSLETRVASSRHPSASLLLFGLAGQLGRYPWLGGLKGPRGCCHSLIRLSPFLGGRLILGARESQAFLPLLSFSQGLGKQQAFNQCTWPSQQPSKSLLSSPQSRCWCSLSVSSMSLSLSVFMSICSSLCTLRGLAPGSPQIKNSKDTRVLL